MLANPTSHLARIRAALEHLPWPVRQVADQAGLVAALDHTRYGCVVAQVDNPDTDGRRLQAALRTRHWLLILLTPRTGVAAAVSALQTGAYDLIELPVVERVLRDRVIAAMRSIGADC